MLRLLLHFYRLLMLLLAAAHRGWRNCGCHASGLLYAINIHIGKCRRNRQIGNNAIRFSILNISSGSRFAVHEGSKFLPPNRPQTNVVEGFFSHPSPPLNKCTFRRQESCVGDVIEVHVLISASNSIGRRRAGGAAEVELNDNFSNNV